MLFLKAAQSSKFYVYLMIYLKKQPDSIVYRKADFMLVEDGSFLTIIPSWLPDYAKQVWEASRRMGSPG